MNDPDYRQQEENEQEYSESIDELRKWFIDINRQFEETFLGGNNDGLHDTKED